MSGLCILSVTVISRKEPRMEILFVDRDGDTLSCIGRSKVNPIPDPVLTITRNKVSQSVVFTETEAREFIAHMAREILGENWGPLYIG